MISLPSARVWAAALAVADAAVVCGTAKFGKDDVNPSDFDWTRSVLDVGALAVFKGLVVPLLAFLAHESRGATAAAAALAAIVGIYDVAKLAGAHELHDEAGHLVAAVAIGMALAIVETILLALHAAGIKRKTPQGEPDELGYVLLEHGDDDMMGTGASFRRVTSLAWPERYLLSVALVCLFVSSAAQMIVPTLFGKIIESISKSKSQDELDHTVLVMVGVFVVASVFSMFRGALFNLAGERLVARFRVRVFDAVIGQDISFFDVSQSGELQSRLSNDTTKIQDAVTANVSMGLRWLAQIVVGLAILFALSWKLTLIMLSVIPALVLVARWFGLYIKGLSTKYQESLARGGEVAAQAFSCIRTVRAFSKEEEEVARYRREIIESYKYGVKQAWAYGGILGGIGLAGYLAVALVLWYGGRLVIQGSHGLNAARLTAFLLYTIYIAVALGGLSSLYSQLMSAVGASERMFELIDRKPGVPTDKFSAADAAAERAVQAAAATSSTTTTTTAGASTTAAEGEGAAESEGLEEGLAANGAAMVAARTQGQVTFESIHFSYPSRPDVQVLKDVSFKCAPGQINAFVGPSGGGKSTIINLLLRFYDPDQGRVLIDGKDIRDMSTVALHKIVGVVPQQPTLFSMSIQDNIRYGLHREVTMDEVVSAAKQANAHDFITRFPEGYDTMVGERGVTLSGGERQRVAIARALLSRPRVLLLDEATSALDSESEHLVQEALDRIMVERTTLVIAHRLSTVRNAHCILVVQDGSIAERGTHEALMALDDGLYKSLVSRQLTH